MKKISVISAIACLLFSGMAYAQNNPAASEKAVVVAGNARFTVLTDRLIRMEWAADGVFEDNATLAIVNRNLPVPSFTQTSKDGSVQIKTKSVTLTYTGYGKFDENNLKVSFRMGKQNVTWHPGLEAKGNLLGTSRTLDRCEGRDKLNPSDPMELGIVSRDGWAIVDESDRHLFIADESDWGEWVAERPSGDRLDLYIFAYGHDYTGALADFTKVAGKIPMPPKYVFGYWWSRYWAYSDQEFLALGEEFRNRGIPMDVMIIDMDWHETWQGASRRERRDEFGQSVGWTGYNWNKDLFGDPEGFLGELHDMGFKTALNLHPASGIRPRENCYEAFVADYISRTDDYDGPEGFVYKGGEKKPNDVAAKKGYHAAVPFRMSQQAWADAYFNSVIHPLEKQGVDFWWLDWQQWKESRYVNNLSNTFWLNYTFFNDKVRRNRGVAADEAERPMTYHRWGGLGSHRYQLGFSGDTYINWDVLGFLPYFTATASNVGYGYWGHDLGGHMQHGDIPTDPELYTRWLQYGVFSPLFKTHCTSSAIIERRIWMFKDHYQYMFDAFNLRYALTPYIYASARQAYDTGVSLCRPMYYYYPEDEKAYTFKEQYFFGDNILAATVCTPVDEATKVSKREVWFPAGNDWYDMAHHKMIAGGAVKTLDYTIGENCWFVKAGAIIPMAQKGIQSLQDKTNAYRIYVAPGKGKSSFTHYEDDENSQAYATDYATTLITKEASSSAVTVNIAAREGSYKGMDPMRDVTIVLGGLSRKPASAVLAGEKLETYYDSETKEATIKLPMASADKAVSVTVKF